MISNNEDDIYRKFIVLNPLDNTKTDSKEEKKNTKLINKTKQNKTKINK